MMESSDGKVDSQRIDRPPKSRLLCIKLDVQAVALTRSWKLIFFLQTGSSPSVVVDVIDDGKVERLLALGRSSSRLSSSVRGFLRAFCLACSPIGIYIRRS